MPLNMMMPKFRTPGVVNHTTEVVPAILFGFGTAGVQYDSPPFSVNVTNGVGPFTYSATWLTGGASITIVGATTNAPFLQIQNTAPAGTYTGTMRVAVTDTGNGSYTTHTDVPVEIELF